MGFTTTHSHGDGVCKIPDSACAAYREQQRIIDLIEKRVNDCYEKDWSGGWSFSPDMMTALINGENE